MLKLILGIGLKAKLYAAAVAGFAVMLGLAVLKGQSMQEQKNLKRRLDGMKNAQKVEKEIEDADRDTVIDINSKS